jgi:hypothetical protein
MVHGGVAAGGVFDEKRYVWRVIEQLLQQRAVDAGGRKDGDFGCRQGGIGRHVFGVCGARPIGLTQLSSISI